MVATVMARTENAGALDGDPAGKGKKITVIGCGTAACVMVKRLLARGLPKKASGIYFTSDDDKGWHEEGEFLGVSRDSIQSEPHPEIAWSHYDQTVAQMSKMLADTDVAVVVMSLGGEVGTALAPLAARAAYTSGAATLSLAVMPFSQEKHRHLRANHSIGLIRAELPSTVILENDNLLAVAGKKPIGQALGVMDDMIHAKLAEMFDAMLFEENYSEERPVPRDAVAIEEASEFVKTA